MRHSFSLKSYDGTEIYYDKWVTPHAPLTLLFLHGLGGDLTAWNSERNALLEQGFGSIAVDLRGHGLSGRPQNHDAYQLTSFAKDIELLVKKEFKKPPVIIGHCFGGMVAMVVESTHKTTAKSLILIDTHYKPPFYSELFLQHSSLLHLLHLSSLFAPRFHLKGHADFNLFKNTGDYDVRRIASDMVHVSLKSYLTIIDNMITFNGKNLLHKIHIPVLIIEGTKDSVFPPHIAYELHRRITTSRITYIPGANHILVLNNPYDLFKEIHAFIT